MVEAKQTIFTLAPQNQASSTLGSTLLRCDKLDQVEIKSLLMCFLHVLKSMSEGENKSTLNYIS